jgi:hypothetical protein
MQTALYQQTDVAGLQGYGAAGVRAASGKNHLSGKRHHGFVGKVLSEMKSCLYFKIKPAIQFYKNAIAGFILLENLFSKNPSSFYARISAICSSIHI